MLAARSGTSLDAVVQECIAAGGEALAVPTDMSRTEQVEALVVEALRRFRRIDVWVGAASVYGFGGVLDMPEDDFARILDVNVMGQVRGVRAVLPHLLARRAGTIVLVGSVFAKLSAPYVSAYVSSKHALSGFTDSLRQELRGSGVRVAFVMPTTIDTPIHQHAANYTGRRVRPLFPVVSAQRVARTIVARALRPRRSSTVGVVQSSMIPVRALAHGLYDAIITTLVQRVGLRDEPQSPHPGTLYEPDPASNAVSGGWSRSGRHVTDPA